MIFLCKTRHWPAVQRERLYYISELQLAVLLRHNSIPCAGDVVKFIANHELGTARIVRIVHNGYAGHMELADITTAEVVQPSHAETTNILDSTPVDVMADISVLQQELQLIETRKQDLVAEFDFYTSKANTIHRRIAGKPVLLTKRKRAPKKRPVKE